MPNIYTWKINQLDAKINKDGLENVIYTIHWSYTAKDELDQSISASNIGTLSIQYNEGDPFIPYADLTKDEVIGWLDAGLDVDIMKSNLDNQIELIKNPVNEYLQPDWD